MLTPNKMYWNSVSETEFYDKNGDCWPRMRWSMTEWKAAIDTLPLNLGTINNIFDLAVEHLENPLDEWEHFKYYRFLLWEVDFIVKLKPFLISKGGVVEISAKKIFDELQYPKQVIEEGKTRIYGDQDTFEDVCGRAATYLSRWSNYKEKPFIRKMAEQYAERHKGNHNAHAFLHDAKVPNLHLDKLVPKQTKFRLTSVNEFANLSWKTNERGGLLFSSATLYILLGLPLTASASSFPSLIDGYCYKNCNFKYAAISEIPTLYSVNELKQVVDANKDIENNNSIISYLYNESHRVVCFYLFILALFFFFFYLILFLFQNVMGNELKQLIHNVKNRPNYVNECHTFTLIVPAKKSKQDHAFNELFSMLISDGTISRNLKEVLKILVFLQVGLNSLINPLLNFLIDYSYSNHDISPSEARKYLISDDTYLSLTMLIYEKVKKLNRFVKTSSITNYVPFFLRCLWSADYTKNSKFKYKCDFADIEWSNIPMSSEEVLNIYFAAVAMVDQLGQSKFTLIQWFKMWIILLFHISGLVQGLNYIIEHVEHAIGELNAS